MPQLCVHTLLDWFCTLSSRTEVEGLCHWSHILNGERRMRKSPLDHFHMCHTLSYTSQPLGAGWWHPCFPDEEITEAKRDGGCIVIPLLWKHRYFLWETIFLYLGPRGWGGTDTDLTNQSISTTWSVIGSGMNMWSRLSQWDSIPVYLFHCGTENLSVALETVGDYLAIIWVETAWKWSPPRGMGG